jgi:hypothetical protein
MSAKSPDRLRTKIFHLANPLVEVAPVKQKRVPVRIKCHFGEGTVWGEASPTLLSFYDVGHGTEQLVVPLTTTVEKQRALGALKSLFEFIESYLDEGES